LLHLLGRAGFSDVVVRARGNALTVACYKAMAICTRFIMPQERSRVRSVLMRLAGVGFVPAFVAAAVVANVSLRYEGGDDCLGYTVLAPQGRRLVTRAELLPYIRSLPGPILITGASGLIGASLYNAIAAERADVFGVEKSGRRRAAGITNR